MDRNRSRKFSSQNPQTPTGSETFSGTLGALIQTNEYDDSVFAGNSMKLKMFATFAPTQVLQRAIDRAQRPLVYPDYEVFESAVMFADISGFSALADRLTKAKGIEGMELLNSIINSFFAVLGRRIFSCGGDVIKFSGDAMLAIWPVRPGQKETLQSAVCLATKCALLMLQDRPAFQSLEGSGIPINLQVHIALGAGKVVGMHVGGVSERAEYVIGGEPLHQITKAEHLAKAGMLVVSPEVWSIIRGKAKGSPVLELDALPKLDGLEPDLMLFTPEAISNGGLAKPIVCQVSAEYKGEIEVDIESICSYDHIYVHVHSIEYDETTAKNLRNEALTLFTTQYSKELGQIIWRYTSESIRPRLTVGEMVGQGELRRVTILFVRLSGLNYDVPSSSVVRLQNAMSIIQGALADFEGVLSRLQIDDKGTIVKAAFGLPPRSHEDDPVRALLAAMQMQEQLESINIHARIGLATSTVFFGVVGSNLFRELSTVGSTVNLAARMMQAANDDSPILCEDSTYRFAHAKIKFVDRNEISVKGWKEKIHIYFPCGTQTAPVKDLENYPMHGRVVEKRQVDQALRQYLRKYHSFSTGSRSGIVLIDGALGMGKSKLISEVTKSASNYSIFIHRGSGDEVFQNAFMHAWKQIFLSLFSIDPDQVEEMDVEKATQVIHAAMKSLLEEKKENRITRKSTRMFRSAGLIIEDDEDEDDDEDSANSESEDDRSSKQNNRRAWVANPYVRYDIPRVSAVTQNTIYMNNATEPIPKSHASLQEELSTLFRDIGISMGAVPDLVVSEEEEEGDSSGSDDDDIPIPKAPLENLHGREQRAESTYSADGYSHRPSISQISMQSNIFSNETPSDQWELYLPLLNQLFNVSFPENGVTGQLYGPSRVAALMQYLHSILFFISKVRPILIVMEDIQWIDPTSLSFLKQIAYSELPLLLICTRRISETEAPSRFSQKLIRLHITLEPLSEQALTSHLCDVLCATSIHRDLFEYIMSRSKGNPMIAQQIALALQSQNHIENKLGELQLKQSSAELVLTDSGNLQAMMTSYINKLDVNQQLTLQVASVIGKVFTKTILIDVFPQEGQEKRILNDLTIIEDAGLITPLPHKSGGPTTDRTYQFTYVLVHEVCYGMVSFKMRKRLHTLIATWYEKLFKEQHSNISFYCPNKGTIARHWEKAEELKKALAHYIEAADASFAQGSFIEASHYYEKVVNLMQPKDEEEKRVKGISFVRLGISYFNQSKYLESRNALENALGMFGREIPESHLKLMGKISKAKSRSLLHKTKIVSKKFFGHHLLPIDEDLHQSPYIWLTELYMAAQQRQRALLCNVRIIDLLRHESDIESLMGLAVASSLSALLRFASHQKESAKRCIKRALDLTSKFGGFRIPLSLVAYNISIYYAGLCEWGLAQDAVDEAHAIALQLKDNVIADKCEIMMAKMAFFRSWYEYAHSILQSTISSSKERGDVLRECNATIIMALCDLRQGKYEDALRLLDSMKVGLGSLGSNVDFVLEQIHEAAYARYYLYTGDMDKSVRIADDVMASSSKRAQVDLISFDYLELLNTMAEVNLIAWKYIIDLNKTEREEKGIGDRIMARRTAAKYWCEQLKAFGATFPIALPYYYMWRGVYCLLKCDNKEALEQLHQASRLSSAFQNTLVLALSLFFLEYLQDSAEASSRVLRLGAATRLFEKMGDEYYLRMAKMIKEPA